MGAFRLTLSQLRIAAKKKRRGLPECHDETMRVITALQTVNYEIPPIYKKFVMEADKCFERADAAKKNKKASTLYHLSKFISEKARK